MRAREQKRLMQSIAAIVAVTALAALLLWVLPNSLAPGIGAIVLAPALLIWLWQRPERGLYVLLGASVVLEIYASDFTDDIGRYLPFFQDIATWSHVKGISVSVAELFMVLVLLIWALKGIAARTLRFNAGSLMLPLGLYLLMVLVGEAHGLGSGGDFRLSLWEVRSQVYMFIAYILACNLIKTRRQVHTVIWILLIGVGIKGVQGVWRYRISLHGNLHSVESLFPHEQSYFFNAFLTLTVILFVYGGSRRLKRAALLLLPFVLVASLANQRRAAVVALGVGVLGFLLITYVAHPARRRIIARIVLVLAVLLPPYYIVYAGKSGLIAEPAHAVASAFQPDQRDANSNLYRVNEDKDLLATMRTSPIIGYGYGKPFLTPFPLADISGIYAFWNLLPHDSILWVWMRLGTVGYILLWMLIGLAIIQAATLACRLRDPYLKGLAVFIALMVMQEVVFAYLDLQWENYRNLITLGVLFALLGWLSTVARTEPDALLPNERRSRSRNRAAGARMTHSLAVVDGRLATAPPRSSGPGAAGSRMASPGDDEPGRTLGGDAEPALPGRQAASTHDLAAGRHSILANTLVSLGTQAAMWCFTLVTAIYVPRVLGAASIGILSVASAWWMVGSLVLSLGAEQYIIKRVARTPGDMRALVRVAMTQRLGMAAVLLTGAALVGHLLQLDRQEQVILILLGFTTCIASCIGLLQAAVQGLERLSYVAPGNIGEKIVLAVGSVIALRIGLQVTGVAAVMTLAAVANLAFLTLMMRHVLRSGDLRGRVAWHTVLRGGLPFFWSAAASTLYAQSLIIILGMLTNDTVTGYFGVAIRLFGASLFIPTALLSALYPVLSRQYAADPQALRQTAQRSFEVLVVLGLPLSAGLVELAGPFIHLLYGRRFEGTVPIMAVFGGILMATYLNMYVSQLLAAMDRQKLWMVVSALSLAAIIPISIICITMFQAHMHNGGIGAAVALLITETLQTAFGLAVVARRALTWRSLTFTLRCAGGTVLMAAVIWMLPDWPFVIRGLVGAAIYLGASIPLRTVDIGELRRLRAVKA